MRLAIIFISFCALQFLSSCYKDKGNYDYTDINKISITSAKDTFDVLTQDSLKISPELSSTISSEADYEYEWVIYPAISAPLTRKTISTAKELKVKITEIPGNYALILYVKDNKTRVEFQKRFYVRVQSAYNSGWMVLNEENGHEDISIILSTGQIFDSLYFKTNNEKLADGAHKLILINSFRGEQKIFVLSAEEVTQLYFADFTKIGTAKDLFFQVPQVVRPIDYYSNGTNENFLNDYKPHSTNLISPGPWKFGLSPVGDYELAPFNIYNGAAGVVFFDRKSRAFFKQNSNTYELLPFSSPNPDVNEFDANNVKRDLLYAGPNTGSLYNTVFRKPEDDSLFVQVLDLSKTSPGMKVYPFKNAPGISTAYKYLSSVTVPHLFYVSDNVMYVYDIPAEKAREVYTFPSGSRVKTMKLDGTSKMVVGVDEGDGGSVYFFDIASTGDFVNKTYTTKYSGFGNILDITFKNAK